MVEEMWIENIDEIKTKLVYINCELSGLAYDLHRKGYVNAEDRVRDAAHAAIEASLMLSKEAESGSCL